MSATITGLIISFILEGLTMYKMFKKMGLEGYKAFIPLYNSYLVFKKVWNTKAFYTYLGLTFMVGFFSSIAQRSTHVLPAMVFFVITFMLAIAAFAMAIMFYNYISKSFECGIGMTIILVLLHYVGFLIIGFSDFEYIGNTSEKSD